MLDPIHNQGLRLAIGAFRTAPVGSLYMEADEPSLYSLREKLSLQYDIRLAANPSKIVSEYDQEIPQSQTADNPVAPRGRAAQPSRDTRKTN